MRRYSLVPVRYNEQQLLTRCESIDAELWSIQWEHNPPGPGFHSVHWFADVAPLELEEAQAIVVWLNNRQAMLATLPPLIDIVRPFRSK